MPTSPIPFPPQAPLLRLHAHAFFVVPTWPIEADAPRWSWSCEDCTASGEADTPAGLGHQLTVHLAECAG